MASFTKIGKRWRARVRITGSPTLSEMFDTKAQAMAWAVSKEADIKAGRHRDVRMISDMTIGDLIDQYTEEVTATKPFGKNKAAVMKSLRLYFGEVAAPKMDAALITEFVKNRIRNGAGGVTIGIDLTYLKGVLNVAKSIWKLPIDPDIFADARNYLKYVGLSTRSNERERRATDEELAQIKGVFAAKGSRQKVPMPDIIDFAVATTMRDAEITGITWEDINYQDRTVIIRDRKHPTKKAGNDNTVPLLKAAWEIVQKQPTRKGRIFPYDPATVSTTFTRAVKVVGIEDLHFHDLRHEAISRLFEQGFNIEEVAVFSGHSDWKMLKRYTHIRAKDLHRKDFSAPKTLSSKKPRR